MGEVLASRKCNEITNTEALTDIAHIHMTNRKYIVMMGTAVELGGMMSDMSKLNVTTESNVVISARSVWMNMHELLMKCHLRRVNFSPLSGAKRKPSNVIQLMRKHGTIKRRNNTNEYLLSLTNNISHIVERTSSNSNRK